MCVLAGLILVIHTKIKAELMFLELCKHFTQNKSIKQINFKIQQQASKVYSNCVLEIHHLSVFLEG